MTATVQVVEEHGVDETTSPPWLQTSLCLPFVVKSWFGFPLFFDFFPFFFSKLCFFILQHFMNVVAFLILHFMNDIVNR